MPKTPIKRASFLGALLSAPNWYLISWDGLSHILALYYIVKKPNTNERKNSLGICRKEACAYGKINSLVIVRLSKTKRKGKPKMKKAKATKAPRVIRINSALGTKYQLLIENGEKINSEDLAFIAETNQEMQNGWTQEEVIETFENELKDVNVRPTILPSHVPSIKTAAELILAYETEIQEKKASAVLSMAVRILADVKASGVSAHIAKNKTWAELETNTKTKKESQERDAQASGKNKETKPLNFEEGIVKFRKWLSMPAVSAEMKKVILTEQGRKDFGFILAQFEQVKINQPKSNKVKATI